MRNRVRQIVVETQATLQSVGRDEFLEPWLIDWYLAALEHGKLFWIAINAADLMAKVGETGARDKPNIAGTNHCYSHATYSQSAPMRRSRRERKSYQPTAPHSRVNPESGYHNNIHHGAALMVALRDRDEFP
ncbi:hypothetical protein BQ8794_50252 [Mesorhizobium prunaredense]|uniref:Uncharacterized protein n=1 Tax=Mesorhizobium prunaredense TaxID=1631249 RepID=A0A1R3VH21_9HYPH|nr:hypothetical protein BQ8794_50252 [Mesorhizobium prunaredense]